MSAANTQIDVRVYRSPIAGSTIYVGKDFKDMEESNGFVRFIPGGERMRHPHNHEEFLYPYGEFVTGDPALIELLDGMIRRGSSLLVAVVDPQPLEFDLDDLEVTP